MADDLEPLPRIDDHVRRIDVPPERVWTALLTALRDQLPRSLPRPLTAVWGLKPRTRLGNWTTDVAIGDTIPGFAVAQREPGRSLTLRGSHRFSRYELRFELDASHPHGVELHANTSARFPGLRGWIYRALVIGTGGHRVMVRRLLAAIARRAEQGGDGGS